MLTDLINAILPSLEHLRLWGYWLAFAAALLETTIGIGLVIPGSTIILVLGALSARGLLDVGDLIWFAVAGAILGDNVNYFLGRKYGNAWLKDGFWLIKADHIERAHDFMNVHGAKGVFLGRFIPSVKEVVPFVAGAVRMNRRTFMVWNVLGAIGWGIEWVMAGYLFAQSLGVAELWLSRAGLIFALILIIGAVFYLLKWLIIRKGRHFMGLLASLGRWLKEALLAQERVRSWLTAHPRFIAFVRARFDRTVFSGRTLTLCLLAFAYILALFAGVVEDVITSDAIVAVDVRLANLFSHLRSDGLTTLFTWITLLGKSEVVLVFTVVSMVLLWLRRIPEGLVPLVLAVAGSAVFTYLGKLAFLRPRPEVAVYVEPSFSFPSGHATIAVAFYGFAAFLLIRTSPSWRRQVNLFFGALLIIALIGFSRVYLGVHYLSDVWCGYLVGAMWLVIAVFSFEWLRYRMRPARSPLRAGWVRSSTLALAGGALLFYVWFALNYDPPPAVAAASQAQPVAASTAIFASDQMKFTETLTGGRQEPINCIFIAIDDRSLLAAFEQAGWQLTDKAALPSFLRALRALAKKEPYPGAPISPSFWNAKIQDISVAKVSGWNWLKNARHVKIWRTGAVMPDRRPIYVALANANEGFAWGVIPRIAEDLDRQRELLYKELAQTGKIESRREIRLVPPLIDTNFIGNRFVTDGKALVMVVR